MNHLAETARHYANLAEQYRTELAEEQELNEDLLGLVDALCEELGIDVEDLLEMALLKSSNDEHPREGTDAAAQRRIAPRPDPTKPVVRIAPPPLDPKTAEKVAKVREKTLASIAARKAAGTWYTQS
jgi:hypothetical protein